MNDHDSLTRLRELLRLRQDSGLLLVEETTERRFQVMASEIAAPVLRNLVTTLCLEGLCAHLLMALDEATPYVGLQIDHLSLTISLWPSSVPHELISSVQGGPPPGFRSDRSVSYRGLTASVLEATCVEQLRLVLCPPEPII